MCQGRIDGVWFMVIHPMPWEFKHHGYINHYEHRFMGMQHINFPMWSFPKSWGYPQFIQVILPILDALQQNPFFFSKRLFTCASTRLVNQHLAGNLPRNGSSRHKFCMIFWLVFACACEKVCKLVGLVGAIVSNQDAQEDGQGAHVPCCHH